MLRSLIVFAILIPGLAVALTNRFAALLLYLWFALFRPQEWVWFNIESLRLSLILSLLVVVPWAWLACTRTSPRLVERLANEALPDLTHPLSIGAVLFLACGFVAHGDALRPDISWYWFDYLWRVVLVSLMAVKLITTPARFTLALAVVAASMGVHTSKAGVMSLLRGGTKILQGYGGAFVDNNGYALGMVMILPFMVAAAQNLPRDLPWYRLARRAFLAMVPATCFAVVCTYSRGGFLALSAAALTFILFQRRRLVALVALVPLVVTIVVLLPEGYTSRIETIRTYEEVGETSALSRLHFWRVAVEMVKDHPYGVGFFNYEAYYDLYDFTGGLYGHKRSVHSAHFQVLAEAGYAGALAWVAQFVYAYWLSFRIRRWGSKGRLPAESHQFFVTMANAIITSMTGFLVGGSFGAMALNDITWLTFGMAAALDRLARKAMPATVPAPVRVRGATWAAQPAHAFARAHGGSTGHETGRSPFGGFVPRQRNR